MKPQNIERRIGASLRQRLLAAPEELRAMATAETAEWLSPEFETDAGQQEAVHALLRACSDARAAVFGYRADDVLGGDGRTLEAAAAPPQWVGTERLIALDRAVVAGNRATRLLRQRGVKSTVVTRERIDDMSGQRILTRGHLTFRRRSGARRAA
jgi:hypothetical protein